MFDLFKKKQLAAEIKQVKELEVKPLKGNYPPEVMEIHHEFATAADKLLMSAKTIIDEAATKDVVKVSRLEKLGFKQAAQVTELKPLMQKAELSKEQVELLKHYSFNYPNNKFITEEQVKIICHKYNLVCGDVTRFKGFVPEKNLREIEAFKLKDNDKIRLLFDVSSDWGKVPINNIDESFLNEEHINYFESSDRDYAYITNSSALYYKNNYTSKCEVFNGIQYVKITKKEDTLQICAPVKDMNLTGLKLADGYKLMKHIPDPVVLQPIRGGYLILTAWGDEASDELVVNQKMN